MTTENVASVKTLAWVFLLTTLLGKTALLGAGFAEVTEQQSEIPSTGHLVSVYVKEGKAYNISEAYFDRVNMQCRIDHYLFQEEPLDLGGGRFEDMSEWEILKEKHIPKCIDVYRDADTYEICWNIMAIPDFTVDPCDLLSEESKPVPSSEAKMRPACVISNLPYVPVTTVFEWNAFFSPQSLDASKPIVGLPDKPIPNEKTGEYVYVKGLYEEHFWGRISRPSSIEPDYPLQKTWYESRYLLPIRRLFYGVRQDDSRYLASIFLAEYDVALDKGVFDPEHICSSREGFSLLKQDLRELSVPEEDTVLPPD